MPSGGFRPGAGRKKGSLSIATEEVREFLAKRNFDPIAKLVDLYESPEADHAIKVKIATELAGFVAPKLKALDVQSETREAITVVVGLPRREAEARVIEMPSAIAALD